MGFFDFNHLNVIISWYLLFHVKFEIVAIVFLTHQLFIFYSKLCCWKESSFQQFIETFSWLFFLKVHYTCLFNPFFISKEYILYDRAYLGQTYVSFHLCCLY